MFKLKNVLRKSVLNEYSQNDPIPELTRRNKWTAFFIVGGPASGKTHFYNNFIYDRVGKYIKRFSTDDIADLRRKWDPEHSDKEEGEYVPGSSAYRRRYIEQFLEYTNGENIVIDTTGNDPKDDDDDPNEVKQVHDLLVDSGYDIVFIQMVVPVGKALARVKKRNKSRDQPETDVEYTKGWYTDPEQLTRDEFASFTKEALSTNRAQRIIKKYSKWEGVINYYIVINIGDDRVFLKYENGQLKVRKNDSYEPVN